MWRVSELYRRLKPFVSGFPKRSIPTYAAACTFYMFLSLPSVVILICSIVPQTSISQDVVMGILESAVPSDVFNLVSMLVDSVYASSVTALSLSIILTLWSATLGVAALMRGLRAAYQSQRSVNYIRLRLRAAVYMIIFLAALVLTLVLLVFGQELTGLVQSIMPEGAFWAFLRGVLKFGRHLVSFAVLFVVFLLMYRFGSDAGLKLGGHLYGALLASLGWLVLSAAFSGITSITSKYSLYGILGTVIAAMLWLYYCIYILLVGGYLNSVLAEKNAI